MREGTKQLAYSIVLGLVLILSSIAAFGQGGTGKGSANANSSKTEKPVSKDKNSNRTSRSSSNKRSYVPTGPTARDMIFLRDFLKSNGSFDGVMTSFLPVDRCKASVTINEPAQLYNRRFRTYTFSFSDIDAGRIRAELSTSEAGYFDGVDLVATGDRKVIEEKFRYLFASSDKDQLFRQTDRFGFSFKDTQGGENQSKVVKALKNLIEICSEK